MKYQSSFKIRQRTCFKRVVTYLPPHLLLFNSSCKYLAMPRVKYCTDYKRGEREAGAALMHVVITGIIL